MALNDTTTTTGPTIGTDDEDPFLAELDNLYLDGTLVLIADSPDQRSPGNPVDLHEAVVGPDERIYRHGDSGPAWRAEDLYTDAGFQTRKAFAERLTQWTNSTDVPGWSVLSTEHGVIAPFRHVAPYDTTIEDIGDDPTNEAHWYDGDYPRKMPNAREIVTEMDKWATDVAYSLCRWVSSFRDPGMLPSENKADTLLVVAPPEYVEPLRRTGVFEYGIERMVGDPNQFFEFPLDVRSLYEELDTEFSTPQDRVAWLSDAISRLDNHTPDVDESDQEGLGEWTGDRWACEMCGSEPPEVTLEELDGSVYCPDCRPRRCSRCNGWTHETGLGSYPLCADCQTDSGGRIMEPVGGEPESEQVSLEQLSK